jgi:hypothetical protein
MAKIKLQQAFSDIRGKLNGSVFSKNRTANYIRTKSTPINRNTTSQSAARSGFKTLTTGWRGLTQAQQLTWTNAVSNWLKTNSLADKIQLTGAQLYIRLNRVIQTIGGSLITSAPVVSSLAEMTTNTVAPVGATPTIPITYTPAIPSAVSFMVFATAPQSAGKKFVKNQLRYIGTILTADTSPKDVHLMYEAKFGTGWRTLQGEWLWFKLVPAITLTGQQGIGSTFGAVIA